MKTKQGYYAIQPPGSVVASRHGVHYSI